LAFPWQHLVIDRFSDQTGGRQVAEKMLRIDIQPIDRAPMSFGYVWGTGTFEEEHSKEHSKEHPNRG
jgi:hypothetical protein